ncbi:MAG: nucleotidyltransferase family protein [Proteobacteria bacterium]|nr:nucleotidyltransferase family protein [Pseudomonadota bacterium]MBS0573244.1 nucleotidyltransferase family protein [Pseudomonadota bacterium]
MRQTPSALMLFAAGLGTRMGALTRDRPKPLITVAGKALIDHALAQASAAGRVVVNLHYLPDQIRAHLARRPDIAFSPETETILETGGGLRQALPLLGPGPVFTLNSDAVWTGPDATAQLVAAWEPARMDALLLLVPPERAAGHMGAGDFLMDGAGRLTRGPGLVYSGAQILKTGDLAAVPDRVFSLNLVWNRMIERRRLFGLVHGGGWCDVGRPEAIPLAEALLSGAGDV